MSDPVPRLLQALDDVGTPCFVLLLDEVVAQVRRIERTFGGRFAISYAVKANPNPDLLARLRDHVPYLDISSGGELQRAIDAGWQPGKLGFTGPGKRDAELGAAVDAGVGEVVVESVHEARRLDDIAAATGRRQRVAVRITPAAMPRGFGAQMAGRPTPFGIDEEDLAPALSAIHGLPHLELAGLHIYSGAQCLDAAAIIGHYRNCIRLFRAACADIGLAPARLIFGAGLGIPYHENETGLDLDAVAAAVCPDLDELRAAPGFGDCELVLETGRYVVGEAGYYLTSIVSMKSSRGMEICICDGGMNHNLAACGLMGMVIPRNYRFFRLRSDQGDGPPRPYQLVGPLCTALDTLGRQVALPPLAVGDVIAMRSAGAYGASASPGGFISHPPAAEVVL